jgi:ABC-type transport system substrate-binding protein
VNRLVAGSLACLFVLAGCAGGGGSTDGAIFRVGLQDDPKSLDPAIGYDVPSWAIEHLMFESLVTYGPDSRIVPALAASWKEEGGKAYVFTLRPDAKFHDGRDVTAKDVVYSFERLLDPATKSSGASFYGDIVGAKDRLAGKATSVAGVTAVDDHTVRIALEKPNLIFLQLLAMPFASVVPAGMKTEDVAKQLVGSGPFAFDSRASGQRITLKRHPHAKAPAAPAGAKPIDGVEVVLGLNESLEVLKFERGELDVIGALRNIPAADFARLQADPKLKDRMFQAPDAAVHYITLNTTVKPFDKLEVRQAIAKAVDKKRVVQLVNGRGQPANGILPPTMPGFDPDLEGIGYDPAGAKALLAKAGLPQGFAATYYCTSSDTQRKVAQAIQQDLGKIGIKLTIKAMAFPTYLQAKSTKGQVGIGSGNWSQDYPDPSNFLTTMFHSKNIKDTNSLNDSYYKNPQVDTLLDQAEAASDPALRARLFREAEAIVIEDAPAVPLYYPVKFQLVSDRVAGYQLHPVWGVALDGVGLK